jgi:hypothetical protein
MSAPPPEHFELLVSCNSIREKQREALRLHVGRGRRYSVRQLYEQTGVPEAEIENAMRVLDCPAFRPLKQESLASIAKFLGASFVSHYLELSGLGAFQLMDGQPPLPGVLVRAEADVDVAEERKRLIRRLAELEGVQ